MKPDSRKKILLILPKTTSGNYLDLAENVGQFTGRPGGMLVLSLATIAALTPKEFDVKIVDENIERIDFNEVCDIVGIGGFSSNYHRVKRIAEEFRKRDILVALGGYPVTLGPERYSSFADVLIIGEAERIWPEFLSDYLSGNYKSEYIETERFDLSESPVPNYNNISEENKQKYWAGFIQTSRGCPYNCEFCDTAAYAGRKVRYKAVPQIINEVEELYKLGHIRVIGIGDHNFAAGLSKAKEILKALKEWNSKKSKPVTFWAQFSIDLARDDELLKLAAEAGLTHVFVGIETDNEDCLKEAGKFQNLRVNIFEYIQKFHSYGILVSCGCMVGFDNDDLSVFQKQLDFHKNSGIPSVLPWPLQAPDKTPLKRRLLKEGRYIDWQTSNNTDVLQSVTIVPKQMTSEQLLQGTHWLIRELYTPDRFANRVVAFFKNYESSEIKSSLNIPADYIDREGLLIVFRIIKNVILKSPIAEKKAFWRMCVAAFKSSHKQRIGILANCFLCLKNSQAILKQACPDYKNIGYPKDKLEMSFNKAI